MGKSVTIKHMVRLLTPEEGRVFIGDDVVSEANGYALEKIRSRFGVLFQGAALLEWLTVGDNVGLPLRMHTKRSRDDIDDLVVKTLRMVKLEDVFWKHPADLSGGMQKRAGLARAIITEPEIILYDEPTSGLDPVTARTIDRLIDELRHRLGVTSVVVTHDLHSALAIGSRIAMLHNGHIVELATPQEFVNSKVDEVREFLESDYITRQVNLEKEQKA
jgi:phospholipid/cholesterol/gamma-HCH transport system ATP-binding protein